MQQLELIQGSIFSNLKLPNLSEFVNTAESSELEISPEMKVCKLKFWKNPSMVSVN